MMQGQVQQFSSAPQAVGTRKKYRDPNDMTIGRNLMNDKRVIRGNTYAALVAPVQDAGEIQKQREAQRRRLMRASQTRKRAGTPEPVPGRQHMDIQTDSYLEELTERTVEFEAETQTDFLLDRPPSPLFMPAKIGVDIETQIEEGDLFDFDVECEPVLEVLVGKTLEQAMMEVLEEEELESLRRHQQDFMEKRQAELLEVQRMEDAEKRRQDELDRRIQQQAAQRERDLNTMRKVVARSVASAHLKSLKDRAMAHLLDAGIFADGLQLAVDSDFMPSLFHMVSQQVENQTLNREAVANVARAAVSRRLEQHSGALRAERRRLAAIDEADRQARVELQEEKERKDADMKRIENEQRLLLEWEGTPPPEPERQEIRILSVDDEPTPVAVLEDERRVDVVSDKLQELKDMLQNLAEGAAVIAKIYAVEGSGRLVLESFEVQMPPTPEAESPDGENPDAGDGEASDAKEPEEGTG